MNQLPAFRALAFITTSLLAVSVGLGQSSYPTPYAFPTYVGSATELGTTDGSGSAARFNQPKGLTIDSSGNIYVADSFNDTIRKITPSGVVSTIGGIAGDSGSDDGALGVARFMGPAAVAVNSTGDVYVADFGNQTIRKITAAGVVSTFAGLAGSPGSTDGTGVNARFNQPSGIAVDGSGNVFVADTGNQTIRKITPVGVVTTFAGIAGSYGVENGNLGVARLDTPTGVAVDGSGNVYVADYLNHSIRKITPGGTVSTLAGSSGNSGSSDGTGSAARFNRPSGVALDGFGNILVADTDNNTIRRITPAGAVTTLAGSPGLSGATDSSGSAARLDHPVGVIVDNDGKVYVADTQNHYIRISALSAAPTITATATTPYGTSYTAIASSGASSGALVWSLGSGSTASGAAIDSSTGAVTFSSAGTVVFNVRRLADANYPPSAVAADFTLIVTKLPQATLSVNSSATGTYGTPYSATFTGGSGAGALSWALGTGITAPGAAIDAASGVVSSTGAGTVVFKVTKASDPIYQSGTSADFTLTLGKATTTVTLGSLNATYDGTAHAVTAVTLPSPLSVNFTYDGTATVPTNAGTYAVVGTINDANFQGSASGSLVIGKATPVITWATPAGVDYGTVLGSTQLNATANVAGTVGYSPASGSFPLVGTSALTATFTPVDPVNYNVTTAQRSLVVTYRNDSRIPAGFDVQGYYARNLDIQAYYRTDLYGAWQHFWNFGLNEGRQYDAQFIVDEYLELNPDLKTAFGTDRQAALLHWFTWGKPIEDRMGRVPIGFNVASYLARYPDLTAAFGAITPTAVRHVTVWHHYLDYGVLEGRSDGDFEAYNYLATNADLAAVFGTDVEAASLHWYFYGRREGRRIPANFDVNGYRSRNPDIQVVWGNDLYGCWLHYRDTGVYDGRTYDELFRVLEYRARYTDMQSTYGSNLTGVLLHWLYFGKPEGRLGRNP